MSGFGMMHFVIDFILSHFCLSYDIIFAECSTGGKCLSVEYTDKVGELAKKHGLKLHIDGARIFNAAVVSKNYLEMILHSCIM